MTQNQTLALVALGALAAYFYTRQQNAYATATPYPGYQIVDPSTGLPTGGTYAPGTLDDVYL